MGVFLMHEGSQSSLQSASVLTIENKKQFSMFVPLKKKQQINK